MSRVWLPSASSLGLPPCFADLDALVPRVFKIGVTSSSAVSEPRTTATATTVFPRFRDGAAFATYMPDGCRRYDCECLYVAFVKEAKRKKV